MSIYKPVLPGEKIRIAFLFQVASFWPSWESLYSVLTNDPRFQVQLYLVKDDVDKSKQMYTAEAFLRQSTLNYRLFSDEGFDAFSPHIAVLQTPYEFTQRKHHLYALKLKKRGIRVIYIPYGIEIANTRAARHNHFRESVIKNAWRIYTLSEDFRREYEKYCENAAAVRGFGLPRFDMLYQREKFRLSPDIENRLQGRKLVVWHTHFAKRIDVDGAKKQVTPYLDEYIAFAKILHQYRDKLYFLFLPHPRFGDDAVDIESNLKSKLILELLDSCENAYVDYADDYRPSLLSADAIITDRSALAVESGVVGCPVLYLKNPDFDEEIFPPLAPLFNSYEQGTGCVDIQRFLKEFMNGNLAAREIQSLPNFDGNCARRIAEDIVASINTEEQQTEPRRLILFGTGFLYQTAMRITQFPSDCEIVALADNDSRKWGTLMNGVEVIEPRRINEYIFDKIIICVENIFEEEIEQQLLFNLEIPKNKIEHFDFLAML